MSTPLSVSPVDSALRIEGSKTGLIVVAATCFASAWLVARIALPPAGIAPLYPHAGIALAATLVWGWRAAAVAGAATLCAGLLTGAASTAVFAALGINTS